MFFVKHPEVIKLGEIVATSAFDVTGEGWQPVSFDDFGKRVVIGAGTYYGTKALGKAFSKNNPSPSYNNANAIGTTRDNLLNSVDNPNLKSAVNELYRPGASIGSGSTADALTYEKTTGILLSRTGHATKALGYRTNLIKLLNSGSLSVSDKEIAIKILKDLQDALSK